MRIKNLDFLRALAITGVIIQHSIWENRITRSGWIGVDLFFVLSGFLVSGLLFNEIKKYNTVNPKLFLIRRGFKIYPAFYFFLFSTLLFKYFFKHEKYDLPHLLSEIFFLQSYLPSIWFHSWSLAIEEHFYILIAILIWWMTRTGFILKKKQALSVFISIWLLITAMRFSYCYMHRADEFIYFFQSHLRSDGLFFGCILAYCFTFFEKTKTIFIKYQNELLFFALLMLIPLFLWKAGSFYMDSFGITALQFSFAIITGLAALNDPFISSKRFSSLYNKICYIGLYSYSIYLWHAFAKEECDLHIKDKLIHTLIYIPSSIILGILFSKLIEWPMLRLRERVFPSKTMLS